MQEAFDRARLSKPDSELGADIMSAKARADAEEANRIAGAKAREELRKQTDKFTLYGRNWRDYQVHNFRTELGQRYLGTIQAAWHQEKMTDQLAQTSDQDRQSLLHGFASGASLNLGWLDRGYLDSVMEIAGENITRGLKSELRGANYTFEAQYMMKAFADVSRYDPEKRKAFVDFMYDDPKLHTVADVRSMLPRMSTWIAKPPIPAKP